MHSNSLGKLFLDFVLWAFKAAFVFRPLRECRNFCCRNFPSLYIAAFGEISSKYLAAHSERSAHFNGLRRVRSLAPIVRCYLMGVPQGRFFILYAMFEMKWVMYPIYCGAF